MRLSTSPFPFDLTAASADVPAGAAPALASLSTAAGATAANSSFGDLLQAETTPAPVPASGTAPTPLVTPAAAQGAPAALAGGPAALLVASTGKPRGVFVPAVSLALTPAADVVAEETPTDVDGGSDALEGGGEATSEGESLRPAATTPSDAQAQLAALAMVLGVMPNNGMAAGGPAIENLELTVDGERCVASSGNSDTGGLTRATDNGPTLAATPPAGFVRTTYGASGGAAALGSGARDVLVETAAPRRMPSAIAVQPRAVETKETALPQSPAAAPVAARGLSRSAAIPAAPMAGTAPAGARAVVPDTTRPVPMPTAAADSISPAVTALTGDVSEVKQPAVGSAPKAPSAGGVAEMAVPTASPSPAANAPRSVPVNAPGALPPDALKMAQGVEAEASVADGPDDSALASPAADADRVATAPIGLRALRVAGSGATVVREKIAAPSARLESVNAGRQQGEQKQSLGYGEESLTSDNPSFGTNTAKTRAPMPAPASTPAPSTRLDEPPSSSVGPLTFDALVKESANAAPGDLARAAHRAVDSALAMAEHFSTTGAQRGVSLQFSVSGVDLAVRVEMRADGVHTFFRTDSPELRSALAQEWQSVVAAQPAESGQRLVDPVFTSTPGGSSTSSGSDTAGHRQPADAQRQPASESGAPRAFAGHAARRATTVVGATPAAVRPITLSTVRHLHTFA
jgi:hypothetical protein